MNIKKRVLAGETVDLTDNFGNDFSIWTSGKPEMFCLDMNGDIVEGDEDFNVIAKKLSETKGLKETKKLAESL